MQQTHTLKNTSSLSHGQCLPCSGLCQLNDVQGWNPGRFINAQGHGEQLIQLSHRHVTGLEEVAPDKSGNHDLNTWQHGHSNVRIGKW